MRVRKAFEAGLARAESDNIDLTDFLLACGEYLVISLDRLHDQDQIIHDLLAERIPATEIEAHERLAALSERQEKSRAMLETFRRALDAFKRAGRQGRQAFEKAARKFSDTFTSLMAPRKNPFSKHTDVLFTDEDWVRIAGTTEQSLALEEKWFIAVKRTAPEGLDPEQFTVEHR